VSTTLSRRSTQPPVAVYVSRYDRQKAEYTYNLYFAMSVYICLSVCLSVRDHISGTARPIFTKFLCMLPIAVARSSSGGVVIRCVLPVLLMTPFAHKPRLLLGKLFTPVVPLFTKQRKW